MDMDGQGIIPVVPVGYRECLVRASYSSHPIVQAPQTNVQLDSSALIIIPMVKSIQTQEVAEMPVSADKQRSGGAWNRQCFNTHVGREGGREFCKCVCVCE